MKKSISDLGKVLTSDNQKSINGGIDIVCNAGYFNPYDTCKSGHYPHPVYGAVVCCRA